MDFFRHGRPKYGLIEHKIKYIIGSCQKRQEKLYFYLQEGVKNWSLIEEKGLCIQNIKLMDRRKTLWVLREFIT